MGVNDVTRGLAEESGRRRKRVMMQSCHIVLNIHLFPVKSRLQSVLWNHSFLNNHLLSDWDDLEDSYLPGS